MSRLFAFTFRGHFHLIKTNEVGTQWGHTLPHLVLTDAGAS